MHKMLIAIDSEVFTEALEQTFREDYKIYTCSCGDDALKLLRGKHPDIMIIDLSLPNTNGLFVLQQTDYTPSIIIALTGYVSEQIVQAAQAAGVKSLIRIPCTIPCIVSHLNRLLLQK